MFPLRLSLYSTLLQISPVVAFDKGPKYQPIPLPSDLQPILGGLQKDDPLVRFQPKIWQAWDDCAPHVWVDSAGTCTNGADAYQSCQKPSHGGQIIGKKMKYSDKYVLIYTAYYPFNYVVDDKRMGESYWSKKLFASVLIIKQLDLIGQHWLCGRPAKMLLTTSTSSL